MREQYEELAALKAQNQALPFLHLNEQIIFVQQNFPKL